MALLGYSPLFYAQQENEGGNEEKSAELFLEQYTDTFQETFFEALKQKGIENYDKAINLMLDCKNIDPGNQVVDYELARLYAKEKQYPVAEDYALNALLSQPSNLWYADIFVETLRKQGRELNHVSVKLPESQKLNENLALAYFKRNDYDTALKIIKHTRASEFTKDLATKINDSLDKRNESITSTSVTVSTENNSNLDTFESYKLRLQGFIKTSNWVMLQQISEEALESYPSQPFFYYAQGHALNKRSKPRDAIELLEAGLDYLIGDISLANKFYQELADAYNSINNSVRANMYLRKIKPGF